MVCTVARVNGRQVRHTIGNYQTSSITQSATVNLTQEFLAEMLGVRRTSVTEVAQKLQQAGIINYSRGVINSLDPKALQARSCECFETLREQNVI